MWIYLRILLLRVRRVCSIPSTIMLLLYNVYQTIHSFTMITLVYSVVVVQHHPLYFRCIHAILYTFLKSLKHIVIRILIIWKYSLSIQIFCETPSQTQIRKLQHLKKIRKLFYKFEIFIRKIKKIVLFFYTNMLMGGHSDLSWDYKFFAFPCT